jgi:phospho-N-acetylmuramoyl-pentapeptide-transferase
MVVIATTNAVNLTDGLDGLATGTSIMVLGSYLLIAFWQYRHWCADVTAPSFSKNYCYASRDPLEVALISAAAAGACLGFLWWNASPARIFMGDTGSMALGGLIAGLAMATRTVLLLPIIGTLFVIITLSLVIQIISFRTTGKRVFRMSPLHHHFELAGWSEVNIVIRFWIIAGIGVVIGVGLFYGDFLRVTG